jgi:endoglucanase
LLICAFVCYCKYVDGLHIVGNQIRNSVNQVVQLRGVSKEGTEYACVQGWGIFDGPADAALVNTLKSWNVNIVRVPLNEDCWLGINGVNPQYSGQNYINALRDWVELLYNVGDMAVILDLHWTAPGKSLATGQLPMPDQDHAPAFWQQVASTFKSYDYVLFELFNEPFPDNGNWNSTAGWNCLKNGGTCPGVNFQAAGYQQLVTTVRDTGATNILLLGALSWSNGLAQWLQYKPYDPLNSLAAVWHSYNFNYCNNPTCWNETISVVARSVPVIATEIGENDCADNYINPLMNYMDGIGQHYLAWCFNPYSCGGGPCLITNYDGSPSNFGIGYKQHLTSLASNNTLIF